ncbi:MAG TPA: hypothetical protein VGN20_24300 [Mucilaginibacter sp.]|jgi:hypothetical protein
MKTKVDVLGLYYKIWVDAIVVEQSKRNRKTNWKLNTIIPMSVLNGANLLTFFYWMKTIVNKNFLLFFPVSIFNAKPLNGFISIVITFFIPFVILNYLLIFNNDRYKELLIKYPGNNGKLYKKYILFSLGLLIVPVVIMKVYFAKV